MPRVPHSIRLILASGSPRRCEILSRMGLTFCAFTPEVDETAILSEMGSYKPIIAHDIPHDIPYKKPRAANADKNFRSIQIEKALIELSRQKASWVRDRLSTAGIAHPVWIVGADTVILKNDTIVGKPLNERHAREILMQLAGGEHHVATAVSIIRVPDGTTLNEIECSTVRFSVLAQERIDAYLATGEWRGAAGGYRIQDSGELLIESITGSHSNVVGLPIRRFYGMLLRLEFPKCEIPAKFPVSVPGIVS